MTASKKPLVALTTSTATDQVRRRASDAYRRRRRGRPHGREGTRGAVRANEPTKPTRCRR